ANSHRTRTPSPSSEPFPRADGAPPLPIPETAPPMKKNEDEAELSPSGERLQKLIAAAGLASRREAEAWILEGRVSLNGRVVRELGTRADLSRDTVRVDGKKLSRPERKVSLLLNKPRGFLSTCSDPEKRPTVLDLI